VVVMLGRRKGLKRSRWKRRPPKDPLPAARRAELFRRDGYQCVNCGGPRVTPQHVVKRSQGGSHDLDNLLSLCGGRPGDCHDRADNFAAGHGKIHNEALGDQRFRILDERVGRGFIYDAKTGTKTWE
jgi:hypothetical protein